MKTLLILLAMSLPCLAQKPPVGIPADSLFYEGKWYKVVVESVSWDRARDKCKSMGGRLVCIKTPQTWEFLRQFAQGSLWIGLTDEKTQGVWVWSDGSPLTFKAWVSGQPDNFKGAQHWAATNTKMTGWDDLPKSVAKGQHQVVGFICEWDAKP